MKTPLLMASLTVAICCLPTCLTAGPIFETEPNDSKGQAQNLDGFFTTDPVANPNIGPLTSDTTPYVSITGTGNGTADFYSFTVTVGGSRGIFDIDFTTGGLDAELILLNSAMAPGDVIVFNDDSPADAGSANSPGVSSLDPFIDFTFGTSGTYFIRVGGSQGNVVPPGTGYTLQVSLQNAILAAPAPPTATPEPTSLGLMGLGGFGLIGTARRRRKAAAVEADVAV